MERIATKPLRSSDEETSFLTDSCRSARRSRLPSKELCRDELVKKLQEYRKDNISLLEANRRCLLRSQDAEKVQDELCNTRNKLAKLKRRVKALEMKPNDELVNEIQLIVRQLSENSKVANEDVPVIDLLQSTDKESNKRKPTLHLPLQSEVMFEQRPELRQPCRRDGSRIELEEKLNEVMRVNHLWQQDYDKLHDENNKMKAQLWKAESQIRTIQLQNENLQSEVATQRSVATKVHSTNSTSFTSDDVEALKQQIIVCNEDYQETQREVEKLNNELSLMKIELQKSYDVIDKVTLKNTEIRQNLDRVSFEKQHILSELRRLSTSSLPFSPVATGAPLSRASSDGNIHSEDFATNSKSAISRTRSSRAHYGGYVVRDGSFNDLKGLSLEEKLNQSPDQTPVEKQATTSRKCEDSIANFIRNDF